jgi:hypothetical protein
VVEGPVTGDVELAVAIEAVRGELMAAQRAGLGKQLTFMVGKVEVEFVGEMKTVTGGSGGVKFWVVSADGKAERSRAGTHRLKVELIPRGPDGVSYEVAGGVAEPPSE